jgi:hypothetical protein
MTILEFPVEKSLVIQLEERRAGLETIYSALNKAQGLLDALEEQTCALEAEYNIYLRRYSHAVGGIENVEVGFLEYSTGIGVDIDSGKVVFTPWHEEDNENPEV